MWDKNYSKNTKSLETDKITHNFYLKFGIFLGHVNGEYSKTILLLISY